MSRAASVILPAHDEAGYIGPCLDALFASHLGEAQMQVIVVANGCRDATAAIARSYATSGRDIKVIETRESGKLNALGLGDAAARHAMRVYLDADVLVSPGLIAGLMTALDCDSARYVSGIPMLAPAQSVVTRLYARFWQQLPFFAEEAPGFGVFAVNAAARARWQDWPRVISDDTFVRWQFDPSERISVPYPYSWPMIEGWRNLVRVRRRQDRGVAEIAALYPGLKANGEGKKLRAGGLLRRALRDPVGFVVYSAVSLAVRLPSSGSDGWVRGR